MENTLTVPFGKYAGKTIQEIAAIDMNWLIWFSKNYNPSQYNGPNSRLVLKAETVKGRQALLSEACKIVEAYFNEITERNRQNSTSEYFGELKKRTKITVTIKKINGAIVAVTESGSEIRFYDKDFNLAVGDVVNITGTPTKHIEICGVKQTYINRVKI